MVPFQSNGAPPRRRPTPAVAATAAEGSSLAGHAAREPVAWNGNARASPGTPPVRFATSKDMADATAKPKSGAMTAGAAGHGVWWAW